MIGFPLDSHVVYDESGIPSYDRAVSSAPLRELIKRLFSDGVMPDSTSMQISSKNGMTLEAHRGFAICNGCMKLLETEEAITIAPADSAYPRIDKVVLRLDDNADARSCEIAVKKGAPSASPVSLGINRNSTVWEIALADVMVRANVTAITNADITDLRFDSRVCGVISSLSEFDTTMLYQQIQSDMDGFKENEQTEFFEWFENIRGQLSTDAAGNLQNQIDVEKARINELVAQKSDEITEEMYLNFSGAMTTCSTIKIASNGMNGVLRIYNLKWTSNQISMYDTIAVFPEELVPLAFNDGQQNVLYEADDIKLIIQGTSLRVFRKTIGTPKSHNIMLTYALKNPVMTELSDIRIDVNGERHPSAGDAIRAQINGIREEMLNIDNYAYKDYVMVCDGTEKCTLVVGEDVQVGDTIRLTKKGDVSIWYTRTDGAFGQVYPPADGSSAFDIEVDSMAVVYSITGCEISVPKKMHVADLKEELEQKTKPYVIDSERYTYGDDALQAILDGRQILIKVPNKNGGNLYANFMPILQYQLPNAYNNYLTLFYLKDGIAENLMTAMATQSFDGVFGEITMMLSKSYKKCPLEG